MPERFPAINHHNRDFVIVALFECVISINIDFHQGKPVLGPQGLQLSPHLLTKVTAIP